MQLRLLLQVHHLLLRLLQLGLHCPAQPVNLNSQPRFRLHPDGAPLIGNCPASHGISNRFQLHSTMQWHKPAKQLLSSLCIAVFHQVAADGRHRAHAVQLRAAAAGCLGEGCNLYILCALYIVGH